MSSSGRGHRERFTTMPLRGELNSVDLAHVFQMLILNQKAGTLEIVSEGVRRPLFFAPEGITVPHDEGLLMTRAGRALVRKGLVNEAQLERARCNMGVVGKDLLGTLVEMKLLDAAERLTALRAELEEEVYELFFLRDASFEFRDGDLPEGSGKGNDELALSPNALIMEAARRIDEWEYIRTLVASGSDIVERRADLNQLDQRENDTEARLVYEAVDGIRTVDEVIEVTHIPRFVVFRKTALMLDAGVAGGVPPADLVARARACLGSGRFESAVNLFERAISCGVSEVNVLAGAGQAHETLGRIREAANRYLAAGRRAEENGDLDSALKLYIRIRRLLPTQVEARERLFALRKLAATHFERDCYNAEAEGFELARILFALGRSEELALVLSGLLDLAGDRSELVEDVSGLSAQLGQAAFAIDALLRSSEIRAFRKDFLGAIICLKKAQAIDPSRAELANRIQQFANSDRARRIRRHSVVRAAAMAVGFLLLFIGYGHYSTASMETYAEYSLEDFLVTGKFDEGREYYQSIQWQYPLTIPFLLSFEMLRELEVAERHYVEVEEYRARMHEDETKGNMRQARIFFEAALNARHTGNYTEAVELLRKVQLLSGGKDPLDSQTAIADLEQYLATARRLRSEATFYRNAGRFEEAHARLTELMAGYSNSPEAGDVGLPVRVTSEPSRARILLNGQPVRIGTENFHVEAETPFVLDLPHEAEVNVTLVLDGHASTTLGVNGTEQSTIHVRLPRKVDQETILPQEVVQPLAADGSRVFAALASGRVVALSEDTLEVAWIRELPELADVAGPLSLVDGMLAVPVSLKKLIMLDPEDGRLLKEYALSGRPESRAVVSADRIAICTAGGELATGPVDGSELQTLALPTPISAGPEALEGGRFVVGCEDGKVWICAPGGSMTSMLNPSSVAGAATALRVLGASILMGDSAGVLHHFQQERSGRVDSVELFPGRPLRSIDPHERFVIAGDGNDLVRLDLDRLTVGAPATLGRLSLSSAPGAYIVAATLDGIIHVMDRTTLEERGQFSAQAEVTLPGLLTGERALFPASGGKVVGIFFPRR